MSWMKLSSLLDEMVLDESVFGRKCFWMKVFLDEFFFAIWMKVYLTGQTTTFWVMCVEVNFNSQSS